ncbi:MAG: hypothetical protein J5U17_00225 [Candidatus Methanoperedens sp.]|nr:hypothetical protein [Candidatus Methanoperedens sp.]
MCFADASVSVEIDSDEIVAIEYKCGDCNSKFRALGKKVSCPSCQSKNLIKM